MDPQSFTNLRFMCSQHENGDLRKTKVFKERIRFYDRAFLNLKAGRGGDGHKSFVTDRNGNKIPDGERGGDGGDIILEASRHSQSLKFEKFHHIATKGEDGKSNNKRGRKANDYILKVPVGTSVRRVSREPETRERRISEPIADLDQEADKILVAKGGKGGLGNVSFKAKWRRRPEIRELGEKGESVEIFLELKSIADVGLVGFPNAGKSSFLRQVSKARPKVGHWPFTTLRPHIGIVEAEDPALTQFTLADIPGLIEGASSGKGLGHNFLRHIERTKVLLFVLDGASTDLRCPAKDFNTLKSELNRYSSKLAKAPGLVFLNKKDLDEEAFARNQKKVVEISPFRVLTGSAKEGSGDVQLVISELHELLKEVDPERFPSYEFRHKERSGTVVAKEEV